MDCRSGLVVVLAVTAGCTSPPPFEVVMRDDAAEFREWHLNTNSTRLAVIADRDHLLLPEPDGTFVVEHMKHVHAVIGDVVYRRLDRIHLGTREVSSIDCNGHGCESPMFSSTGGYFQSDNALYYWPVEGAPVLVEEVDSRSSAGVKFTAANDEVRVWSDDALYRRDTATGFVRSIRWRPGWERVAGTTVYLFDDAGWSEWRADGSIEEFPNPGATDVIAERADHVWIKRFVRTPEGVLTATVQRISRATGEIEASITGTHAVIHGDSLYWSGYTGRALTVFCADEAGELGHISMGERPPFL